jgi:hypothetical protein
VSNVTLAFGPSTTYIYKVVCPIVLRPSSPPIINHPTILHTRYKPKQTTLITNQPNIKMQFSTIVLALAASASAAVIPRDNALGQWHVQITVNQDQQVYLTAKFSSDAYPEGLRNACIDEPTSTPPYHRCDHLEFDFAYDGNCTLNISTFRTSTTTNILIALNLTQTVDLPTKQTVFGEAFMPVTKDLGDGRMQAEAIVPVIKAIA